MPLPELWRHGYVVAATDYEGLGTPGLHPYIVGESEARGVLDAIRAARRLADSGAGKRALVYGHSQGGHAALFAGQIGQAYAPELDLVGVVAAAPASELSRLAQALPASPYFGYVVATAVGYSAVYPEVKLGRFLTPSARAKLNVVKERCIEDVFETFRPPSSAVLQPGALESDPWPRLLARNTPGNVRTSAPILVVQGGADEQIPAEVTRALVQPLCGRDDTVDFRLYPESEPRGRSERGGK